MIKIKIKTLDGFNVDDFLAWSETVIGLDNWFYEDNTFRFVNDEDALAFKLRYGL